MSDINVTIEQIASISDHPNADRLEIAKILGTQTVVSKGQYQPGDKVVFFPPDILIPADVAQNLGVQQYLKYADFNGHRQQCRVAAARLRGVPSYGFVAPDPTGRPIGTNVSDLYMAKKYEPPEPVSQDIAPEFPTFHTYTNIQHYWAHPNRLRTGEQVVITEKIHGTNSRVGLIQTDRRIINDSACLQIDNPYEFMAGSHRVRLKKGNNIYWAVLEDENILSLLTDICDERYDVVLFGEIFGPRVQDLDYGVDKPTFRAFDLTINGQYVNYSEFKDLCDQFNVPTVPVLFEGRFTPQLVDEFTHGPTLVGNPTCKFKGREGIVIKPCFERQDKYGRVILKSVSADYLNRRGGTDK